MAVNNFKPFATGNGANVTNQADYEALPALTSGFQAGKASSAQVNKALRQSSTIAAALAQFIADNGNVDVLDNGDVPGISKNLLAAIGKQFMSSSGRIQYTDTGSNIFSEDTRKKAHLYVNNDGTAGAWDDVNNRALPMTVAAATKSNHALQLGQLGKVSFSNSDFVRIPDIPGGLLIQWVVIQVPDGADGTNGTAINFSWKTSMSRPYALVAGISGATANRTANAEYNSTSGGKLVVKNQGTGLGTSAYIIGIGQE